MSHPVLGLPPADPTVGLPEAARQLRAHADRLSAVALEQAVRDDPTLRERYDDLALRHLLRDCRQHIQQLARSLETGEARFVVQYAEWIVPLYRRRRIQGRDYEALIRAIRDASAAVLAPAEVEALDRYIRAWIDRIEFHRRLPGDHRGNPLVRFFYKGTGILDDSVI
jgi:hypothetical protein